MYMLLLTSNNMKENGDLRWLEPSLVRAELEPSRMGVYGGWVPVEWSLRWLDHSRRWLGPSRMGLKVPGSHRTGSKVARLRSNGV